MNALDTALRRTLEKTVIRARDTAEAAAGKALDRLGVGRAAKPDYLTDDEAGLRRRLRRRGRALGDTRAADGAQTTAALAREAAYEQWHRLLFARFLLENDLLVHPEYGVPLGLDDCAEIAKETDGADAFDVAAGFAAAGLPQIFRTDDAVLDLRFAPEDRAGLRRLVTDLDPTTFHADDSLGWVYQFWQAKRKDEVNASGVKIGAEELPAVTQLFTEDYMVRFLLENTLGAWWLDRTGTPPPTEMPYLRTLDDGTPAAGGFPGWPDRVADLRVIDPSMGSGHFLVAALGILVPMRMVQEEIDAQTAIDRVIAENLHGLELDPRCTQIAAFALALAAWTTPGAEGYRELPPMRLACSGLAPSGSLDEWTALAAAAADTDEQRDRLRNGMRHLWTLFQDAPTLGSLIDPGRVKDPLLTAAPADLTPLLAQALGRDDDSAERGVVARGIAEAADLLAGRYHLVATNVPYLGLRRQGTHLKAFLEEAYPQSRYDIATAFADRALDFLADSGSLALVVPTAFTFAGSYDDYRYRLLTTTRFDLLAVLGPRAFSSIGGEVVNVSGLVVSRAEPHANRATYGLDVHSLKTPGEKAGGLRDRSLSSFSQVAQLENPDQRIAFGPSIKGELLADIADSLAGIQNGDSPRYQRRFWEVEWHEYRWVPQQTSPSYTCESTGYDTLVNYDMEGGHLRAPADWRRHALHDSDQRGKPVWGKKGVFVNRMSSLSSTLYRGGLYDQGGAAIVPGDQSHVAAIWAFCSSPEFYDRVRSVDRKINVTNSTLAKVAFDLDRWQRVAKERYPDGLPDPQSDDPTQWLFHGHPAHAEDPSGKAAAALHVALARLVGYRWPAERDADMELAAEARALVDDVVGLDSHADEDGIVCLPAVHMERPATDRLLDLLRDAFGDAWTPGTLDAMLEQEGVKRGGLEKWLRDKAFVNHCGVFGWRPFIWHITDGHREGFSALVNVHQLDRAGLEKLLYTYLGDWIARQKRAAQEGAGGADGRLQAAEDLSRRLKLILDGEPPYDVFVRWKSAAEQSIGWDPDLNDGVLLNIRPFVQAGVLGLTKTQAKRFKYTKDRGKNPPGEPWGPERHNRYEDLDDEHKLHDADGRPVPHLTNAVKRAARETTTTDS